MGGFIPEAILMCAAQSALVVGSGAAGTAAARMLAAEGIDVTVAEAGRVGGTCLWAGCIPKKALYRSASIARLLGRCDEFGVGCARPELDWQTALAWKWHAQETYAGDQEGSLASRGIRLIKAPARFLSPDELQVGEERLSPDHVVLACGSRPVTLPVPGIELADTSDAALRYAELPGSLTVIGGGFIAMELAGIFSSWGTRIVVVTRADRVLDMLDEDLADVAVRRLSAMGVQFVVNATVSEIRPAEGGLESLVVAADGNSRALPSERVLCAVGRRPEFDGLALEAGGIETDPAGHLVVDPFLRTTNPRVWAAGDAAGGMMQTPVANMEGRTVAQSIISGTPAQPQCSALPITCFTVPQLATVGLTETAASAAGREVRVHKTSLDGVAAGIIDGETDGFAKILSDPADGTVLGAQVAGPTASDVIYAAALAVKGGLTVSQLQEVPAVHPSFAEALGWAAW